MTDLLEIQKNDTVLVHVCCAPCMSYSFEKLIMNQYKPAGYFYNPNIHPRREYDKRLNELLNFAGIKDYNIIIEDEHPQVWFDKVKGHENDKEGGTRCEICFKMRLEKTALYAKQNNFAAFTTVLTISPHKNSSVINGIGKNISEKYGIEFIEENFKKQDGFKKSLELSKKYGFYRQNYCGCVYSNTLTAL